MSKFPENMSNGLKCGVWGDTQACNAQCWYVYGNSSGCVDPALEPNQPLCTCGLHMAPVSVWTYVAVCCCFNLLMLFVIKEGTAVLFWISSAATVPLVAIISTTDVYTWLDLGQVHFSII